MNKIFDQVEQALKNARLENWTNRGMGKKMITPVQVVNRVGYAKVKQFSQTKLAKQHPEILKKLVKEINITRKKPVVITPTFGAPKKILTTAQKQRASLLRKRNYHARKQKNIAKNLYNNTQFIGFLISDPEQAVENALLNQKQERRRAGGTRKITVKQIEAEIEELKKGIGVGYYRNKNNFSNEEERLDEIVEKLADDMEVALQGAWSEGLNFLYKEYGYDWQTKSLYWILEKIDKLTQIDVLANIYKVKKELLIKKLKTYHFIDENRK